MQDRQATILKQQQVQAEMLMKQIQTQMETELRMKSDLVRNQLSILGEIQMQNPEEVMDMKSLLSQVQQGSAAAVVTASAAAATSSQAAVSSSSGGAREPAAMTQKEIREM